MSCFSEGFTPSRQAAKGGPAGSFQMDRRKLHWPNGLMLGFARSTLGDLATWRETSPQFESAHR